MLTHAIWVTQMGAPSTLLSCRVTIDYSPPLPPRGAVCVQTTARAPALASTSGSCTNRYY